jgi:nitroreductase
MIAPTELPGPLGRPTAPPEQVSFFRILGTARAMRHLKPDPVPTGHIEALVWAATRASSADNSQPWQFLAVTSPAQRQAIADAIQPIRSMVAGWPSRPTPLRPGLGAARRTWSTS